MTALRLLAIAVLVLSYGACAFMALDLLLHGQVVIALLLMGCLGFTWWAFDTGEAEAT